MHESHVPRKGNSPSHSDRQTGTQAYEGFMRGVFKGFEWEQFQAVTPKFRPPPKAVAPATTCWAATIDRRKKMAADYSTAINVCGRCGEQWTGVHVCPQFRLSGRATLDDLAKFSKRLQAEQQEPLLPGGDRWKLYERSDTPTEGCKPLRQLTEEDVRRIVREELAKLTPNAVVQAGGPTTIDEGEGGRSASPATEG